MIVERQNNELLVRIAVGTNTSKIQLILDYLRYEELTSKSYASQDEIDNLVNEAKAGRWKIIKKELGIND